MRNHSSLNAATDSRFYVNGVFATPGYATLNARVGTMFGHCDQHRVSLSLENITDKYYFLTRFDQFTGAGVTDGQPGRPREFALTVKNRF